MLPRLECAVDSARDAQDAPQIHGALEARSAVPTGNNFGGLVNYVADPPVEMSEGPAVGAADHVCVVGHLGKSLS
eukprot:5531984-Pyramimonas_sp.AAC.1